MTVTINGSSGITTPEVTLDNATADGGQVVLKSSGYSNWNLDNYSGRFRAYYGSTEQLSVTSAGLLQFNSGYGSVATAYGCRAWVNFNGTGTVAIRSSGNVSSITDNGTGDYTANFTSAMTDANYSVSGTAIPTSTASSRMFLSSSAGGTSLLGTSGFRFATIIAGTGNADCDQISVQCFR